MFTSDRSERIERIKMALKEENPTKEYCVRECELKRGRIMRKRKRRKKKGWRY